MDPEEIITAAPATDQPNPEAAAQQPSNVVPPEALAALREQMLSGRNGEPGQPKPAATAAPATKEPEVAPKSAEVLAAEAAAAAAAPDPFLSRLSELSGGKITTPESLTEALTQRDALASQELQFKETARLRELLDDPEKLVSYSRLVKTDFMDREKLSDKDVQKANFLRKNTDLEPDVAEALFERQHLAKYPSLKPDFADESDPDYRLELGLRKRDSDIERAEMEAYKEEQRLKFSAPAETADKPDPAVVQQATEKHLETVKSSLADFNQYGVKYGEKDAQIFNYEIKPELKSQMEEFMTAPYQVLEKMLSPVGEDGKPTINYEAIRKIGMAIFGFDGAVAAAATAAFNQHEAKIIKELANSQPNANTAPTPGTVDDRAGLLAAAKSASTTRYNPQL